MNKSGWCLVLVMSCFALSAQEPTWDDTSKSKWGKGFTYVEIPSSIDGKVQKAYVYASKSKAKKPLIVSLHTWSGDYAQKDPLTTEILARDWNYIHPDFRGRNGTPASTGSPLVVSDIEDAIAFALKVTHADPEDVHIVGVSGGGYATLLAYMNVRYPIKSFSAWAPISDLNAWYWESVGRKQKYAADVYRGVSSDSVFNTEEAIKRSPLHQTYPIDLRKNAQLFIYEGIHDGYTGSVPITHAIQQYNRLVGELKYKTSNLDELMCKAENDEHLVGYKEMLNLVTRRVNPAAMPEATLFGRQIHLLRDYQTIRLTIFEGGHEQLPQALGLIPTKITSDKDVSILTISDSNGQIKDGWVDQLRKMLPNAHIVNNSKSGRTIGFDNNGKEALNALTNIDTYLNDASKKGDGKPFDFIVVCLGTNDTKSEFAANQAVVSENFEKLLSKIVAHPLCQNAPTRLIYVTPPPVRSKNLAAKYAGANERLGLLVPEFSTIARQKGFEVVDVYHPLQKILEHYASDGVHMVGAGQAIVALKILDQMERIP